MYVINNTNQQQGFEIKFTKTKGTTSAELYTDFVVFAKNRDILYIVIEKLSTIREVTQ